MGEIFRAVVEWVKFFWPLEIIPQWNRGAYYVRGRYWREFGPGLYFVVPWFTKIIQAPVVPAIIGTPRQDITLQDGGTLSFSATITATVQSVATALNSVDDYKETMRELLGSVLAEKLAEVPAARLAPNVRGRLVSTLEKAISAEAATYGVGVSKLRFTSFVLNIRTYRLLTDASATIEW